ncbi:hypothetical protein BMS3Abin05_02412 [bacterium BMS3Abin05]|nr:hypothetical protein BMS3Abin05_02412 [bacterium BMS3Abin05]
MVLKFLMNYPFVIGLVTILLMLSDYFLTLIQEKERRAHYAKHYQSYPINTIEGNPAFQESVSKLKILNPKHLIATLVIGIGIPFFLFFIPAIFREIFLGYVWGLFLIVITQHLSNLIGYRVSRKGVHGKLLLHQRTGLLIQSGRYLSTALFLLILSILSESQIIYGVTIAGFTSALRLFILSKKAAPIEKDNLPPKNIIVDNLNTIE